MSKKQRKNQDGFLISTELGFLMTVLMGALVTLGPMLVSKISTEFNDIGSAIGALNQSYTITGTAVGHPNDPNHPTDISTWAGSGFVDGGDYCDTCNGGLRFCTAPAFENSHAAGGS